MKVENSSSSSPELQACQFLLSKGPKDKMVWGSFAQMLGGLIYIYIYISLSLSLSLSLSIYIYIYIYVLKAFLAAKTMLEKASGLF